MPVPLWTHADTLSPYSGGVDGQSATRHALRDDLALLIRLMRATDSRRLTLVIVLGIALAVTEGASLLLLVPVLQGLQGETVDVSSWPVIGRLTTSLNLPAVLLVLVLVVIVRGVVSVVRDRTTAQLRLEVLDRQRLAALDAALHARWSWLLSRRGSDIVQTVNTEVARVGFTVDIFARLTVGLFMTIAITVSAMIVAPVVGTIAAGLALLATIALLPTAVTAHRLGHDQVSANRDYAAAVTDAVGSLKLVRAHEAGGRWLTVLHGAMQRMAHIQVQFATRSSIQRAAVQVGSAVGACILVVVALQMGVGADQLIVLVVLVARLLTTTQSLAQTAQMAANNLPAVATVHELLDDAAAHADPVAARSERSSTPGVLPSGPLSVELESIDFAYAGGEPILAGLSLHCPAGETTAITGPSGAGKSTLVDLILGLLTPQGGTVLVGGRVATPEVTREFRGRLGYVPQDVHLLPSTLRENLAWSCAEPVDDEQMLDALRSSRADFIDDLPDGLSTVLGERGVRLSGGQRQRIALARALLRRPDVLVLDEATSALDPATERQVLESLPPLGITVLLVAHRDSTLSFASQVLRLGGLPR